MGPYDCPGGTLVVNSFNPGALGNPTALPTMGVQVDNECTVSVIWTVVFDPLDPQSTVMSFTVGPGSQQTATQVNGMQCDWGASALD
jgi:hypothetical protein